MNNTIYKENGTEILKAVFENSWSSPEFKERLIQDPYSVIEELNGEKINYPEGIGIKVTDQADPTVLYLNIPPDPSSLSDEYMDAVVGGCNGEGRHLFDDIGTAIGYAAEATVYHTKRLWNKIFS